MRLFLVLEMPGVLKRTCFDLVVVESLDKTGRGYAREIGSRALSGAAMEQGVEVGFRKLLWGMERETGIEPATSSLGSWHSTAELLPQL